MKLRLIPILLALAGNSAPANPTPSERTPTFNRDIAPIVFSQCAACHHPGGLGPLSLAAYADVKKAREDDRPGDCH